MRNNHLRHAVGLLTVLTFWAGLRGAAREPAAKPMRASQRTAVQKVENLAKHLVTTNKALWEYAELGLEEVRSADLLIADLKSAGFQVSQGISDMPTAFRASYGSGKPVIAILAEYDALPGMSQQVTTTRQVVHAGGAGHACGHCALGTGALGGALAVKAAMEAHQIPGTVRLYGTPAEETVIGKIYMLLDGQFDDVDVVLHWHPATKNLVWGGSSKALVSVRFQFHGIAAHAAGAPASGRSALDAVELMDVGVNYMREHVKEDARIHYVITNGGQAPNVVPPNASVWYYIRADRHQDVESYFRWTQDIARGAALMTQTHMSWHIETDCHELLTNEPLAKVLDRNLRRIEAPRFSDEEKAFARKLQEPLAQQFQSTFSEALEERIRPLSEAYKPGKGSTDVGDISWYVPVCGIRTTCFPAETPGHSWQNVASIGSSIGEKGLLYAAKVLAVSALDLLEDPELIRSIRADWKQRMKDRKYTTLIPKGQKPPTRIH